MKRRDILKLGSGTIIALPACSGGKKEKVVKKSDKGAPRQPSYRHLPSKFSTMEVTHRCGPKDQPYVAMTFDDGPHPQNTPRLLDILRARNIKATFYVIGNLVDRHPEIVRRIVAEGHEIGNHTYTHRKLTTLNDYAVDEEMRKTEQSIIRATGVKPRTMRPPYGALTQRQRGMIFSRFSYPTIMWSIDPEDWKRPGPSVVASRILTNAHNGAIILAHDLHAPTIDAMPQTFDGLLSRGYQFITVSQMLARKGRA
ncbi:MAG: polysaccharide deacetylase family protein [Akkermansiaceae bacterium]|jgi:peptidoglycan/xylan/chitin deacetylase (PgdA/CDA1 family)